VLVSQIVTQKNIHIKNLTKLMDMMEAEGLRSSIIAAVGGPRIGHELALELGYDIGFGAGTIPSQVASYIATTIKERMENE
jgi:beta-lysine 5,6-aminomutase beta subunit